ncbi:heterokaryon incompatibility protein-domain-containing protein [Phaeosphaeria sp. MPI-PUGE-AT-0046c]|nr:heterokaryon incompatibility protein-domain-containing protein [Phaeosphaeria sp. MPI-PUGE-AT-0046c]
MASGASSILAPQILHPDDKPRLIREPSSGSPTTNTANSDYTSTPILKRHSKVPIKLKALEKPNQRYLADTIPTYFETSTFDSQERQYLPETCLKEYIVTKATVNREFRRASEFGEYETEVLAEVSSWVVEMASKTFATTVQCHLDANYLLLSMINFFNEEFDDTRLPIKDPRSPNSESARPARTDAFSLMLWSDQRHDEFFRFQWSFLAPVFIPQSYEYDLLIECILPFKRVKDTVPRAGSFSSVFKVSVQPDHQQRHSSLESPSAQLVREAINQLRGLADALDRLHNFQGGQQAVNETYRNVEIRIDPADNPPPPMDDDDDVNDYTNPMSQESIRHGDIKPENVLRFPNDSSTIGTLKLGDMGLAKRHVAATEKRRGTSMRYGTRRYEGPETLNDGQGRSRLYDLWSMGCITFEFIIWLLYGNDALAEFYRQAEKSCAPSDFQYYKVQMIGGAQHSVINPIVLAWMDHMQKEDPELREESDSMLKDLLHIVREKLLVVDLPPTRGSALANGGAGRGFVPAFVGDKTKYRTTAAGLLEALDVMQKKASDSNADYSLPPLKSWEFAVDNDFASKVLSHINLLSPNQPDAKRNKLCSRCAKRNFWSSGFSIEEYVDALAKSAVHCDLCSLLNEVGRDKNNPSVEMGKIRFERTQSVITMTGRDFPVLSLMRSPDLATPIAIQIGRPWLTHLHGKHLGNFFNLAQEWLHDCDKSHVGCQVQRQYRLPTRLIDVGSLHDPVLRLVETQHETVLSQHYIALSHPWGDTTSYEAFVTLCKDDSSAGHDLDRFKTSIPYDDLPKTFKHAVDCTRNLGIRYLWIDSICIVQGNGGDFPEESKRMEDVYSGAYCVVAASRASDQRDGFLGARPQRRFVAMDGQSKIPFYVCQIIDRFNEDVINGSLNQRGWVLQERALARRTIYFTENQTYFECGNGVRCETLTKMHNNMADFLGDPNFPDKAMRVPSRALKIEYFQGLYKQYSRLGFTRWEDRPVAIAGLEKRLQRAFNTKGRYGIFDDGNKDDGSLFHRSLLWRRAWGTDDNNAGIPLEVITFPPEKDFHVPSWSWMAYKGGIDFTDPPYRSATWETREIIPPWTRGGYQNPEINEDVAIAAVARDFDLKGRDPDEVKIAYDTEQGSEKKRVQCVIVARSNDARSDMDRRYYVLLVIPTQDECDNDRWVKYKRVGAGFMLGKYITLSRPGREIRIY